jgi:putative membrane protein
MIKALPHLIGFLNALVFALILSAFIAVRKRHLMTHARLMKTAIFCGFLFLILYLFQTLWFGHRRFPGNDWVRTVFLWILVTHTFLAVVTGPMVLTMLYFGMKNRFDSHKRLAKFAYPIWFYVSLTGLIIYWMNQFLRPS